MEIKPPATIKADRLSQQEDDSLFQLKKHINLVTLVFLWFGVGMFISLLGVRFAHMIISEKCWWLEEKQLHAIDKILTSGFIGGIVGKYSNYMLAKVNK